MIEFFILFYFALFFYQVLFIIPITLQNKVYTLIYYINTEAASVYFSSSISQENIWYNNKKNLSLFFFII